MSSHRLRSKLKQKTSTYNIEPSTVNESNHSIPERTKDGNSTFVRTWSYGSTDLHNAQIFNVEEHAIEEAQHKRVRHHHGSKDKKPHWKKSVEWKSDTSEVDGDNPSTSKVRRSRSLKRMSSKGRNKEKKPSSKTSQKYRSKSNMSKRRSSNMSAKPHRSKSRKGKKSHRSNRHYSKSEVKRLSKHSKRHHSKLGRSHSRKRPSKECKKNWPLKPQYFRSKSHRKKRSHRHVKELPILKKKCEVTPTIITLYPSNHTVGTQYQDPCFLADVTFPCKCTNCMQKYQSLMRIPHPTGRTDHVTLSPPWRCDNTSGTRDIKNLPQDVKCRHKHTTCMPQDVNYMSPGVTPKGMKCMIQDMNCLSTGKKYMPQCMNYLPHGINYIPHVMSCISQDTECIPYRTALNWSPSVIHGFEPSYPHYISPTTNTFQGCCDVNSGIVYKSVQFYMNSYSIPIDTNITNYFQKILDDSGFDGK